MFLFGIRLEFFADVKGTSKECIFLLREGVEKFEYSTRTNNIRKVDSFISPNYICRRKKNINLDILSKAFSNEIAFRNDLISFKKDPYDIVLTNEISINSEFLKGVKNNRILEKRPVWIFYGDSGLGKSYIASYLSGFKSIYETDSSSILPDVIYEDVVVLGNKYNFSEDDIVSRLYGDVELIKVNFIK